MALPPVGLSISDSSWEKEPIRDFESFQHLLEELENPTQPLTILLPPAGVLKRVRYAWTLATVSSEDTLKVLCWHVVLGSLGRNVYRPEAKNTWPLETISGETLSYTTIDPILRNETTESCKPQSSIVTVSSVLAPPRFLPDLPPSVRPSEGKSRTEDAVAKNYVNSTTDFTTLLPSDLNQGSSNRNADITAVFFACIMVVLVLVWMAAVAWAYKQTQILSQRSGQENLESDSTARRSRDEEATDAPTSTVVRMFSVGTGNGDKLAALPGIVSPPTALKRLTSSLWAIPSLPRKCSASRSLKFQLPEMPSSQYQERLNHHIPADQQVSNSDVGSGNRRQNDKEPAQAECSHGGQVSEQLDEPQEKVEHAKDEADPQEAEIQGPNLNCEERSCDSKSATECNICFENEGDHVLLPCGHGGYCHTCAHQLLASRAIARTCPMCRAPLTSIAKVSLNAKIGEQACVLRAFAVSPIQTVQNTPSTLLPNLEQSHSSMEDSGPTANRTTPIGAGVVASPGLRSFTSAGSTATSDANAGSRSTASTSRGSSVSSDGRELPSMHSVLQAIVAAQQSSSVTPLFGPFPL